MEPADEHGGWADRTGEYSPEYYAQIGPNEVSDALATVIDYYADDDAAILEIGCSSGRHLAHLREAGFENLTGIDINDESFEVMADHFPDLAATGTFHTGAIEDVVPDFADGEFDAVYSVETLQHVHPDNEWVYDELVRASDDLLITAENEGNSPDRGRAREVSYVNDDFPLYFRDWNRVFTERGLAQLTSEGTKRDTIRVFRVP